LWFIVWSFSVMRMNLSDFEHGLYHCWQSGMTAGYLHHACPDFYLVRETWAKFCLWTHTVKFTA
jgi:hypothetical protein